MLVNRLRPFWPLLCVGCLACGNDAGPSSATPLVASASALHRDGDSQAAQDDDSIPVGSARVHPRAERGGALTEAYAALARGDQPNAQLIASIDEHAAANPDDRYGVFYRGVFRLWWLVEGGTPESLLGSLIGIPDMLDNLERAHALIPEDFRVTAFCGLGQLLVGGMLSDDELLDKGMATLDQAIEEHPPYGRFLRAMGLAVLSKDHQNFHYVLDDMLGATVDCKFPSGRDGAAYQYPTDAEPRSRVCLNLSIVPFVWEGIFMSYGDMALKAGWDAERVRALYLSAKTSPDYEDWPFREALEQRIADVDERVAAVADDDPANDPSVWALDGHVCTGCHKDVASLIAQ